MWVFNLHIAKAIASHADSRFNGVDYPYDT